MVLPTTLFCYIQYDLWNVWHSPAWLALWCKSKLVEIGVIKCISMSEDDAQNNIKSEKRYSVFCLSVPGKAERRTKYVGRLRYVNLLSAVA